MAKKKKSGKKNPIQAGPVDPQQAALEALYGKEGVAAGNALIGKFLPEGALGSVSTDLSGQKGYLDQLKASLGGYSSSEYQAQREQQQRGLNSSLATAMAQQARAQARGKVYGAAAGAQQQNLIRGADDARANLEQQLMVKDIDERQNRLKDYGSALSAYDASNLEREKLNLGQRNAELASKIGAFTGAAGQGLLASQIAAANAIQKQGIKKLS